MMCVWLGGVVGGWEWRDYEEVRCWFVFVHKFLSSHHVSLCPLEAFFQECTGDSPCEMTDECNGIYAMVRGLLRPERAGTKQSHVNASTQIDRTHRQHACVRGRADSRALVRKPRSLFPVATARSTTTPLHRAPSSFVTTPAQAKASCNS
jgi:hypothetical protein